MVKYMEFRFEHMDQTTIFQVVKLHEIFLSVETETSKWVRWNLWMKLWKELEVADTVETIKWFMKEIGSGKKKLGGNGKKLGMELEHSLFLP